MRRVRERRSSRWVATAWLVGGLGSLAAGGCGDEEPPLCTGNECVCRASEICAPRCIESGDCDITCQEDSVCDADCGSGWGSCSVRCGTGSTCATLCVRSATCAVECLGAAHCEVDCGTAASCEVHCPEAECVVHHCELGRNCTVTCGATGTARPSGTDVICG